MDIFAEQLKLRKEEYFKNQKLKDELFRDIEHEKTKLRIIQSKTEKDTSSKINFPFKVSIEINKANLKSKYF